MIRKKRRRTSISLITLIIKRVMILISTMLTPLLAEKIVRTIIKQTIKTAMTNGNHNISKLIELMVVISDLNLKLEPNLSLHIQNTLTPLPLLLSL